MLFDAIRNDTAATNINVRDTSGKDTKNSITRKDRYTDTINTPSVVIKHRNCFINLLLFENKMSP